MARKTAPLSDTEIKNAKPKEKQYTLGDGQGLRLLITPDGKKLWQFQYSFNAKRYLSGFGLYPTG